MQKLEGRGDMATAPITGVQGQSPSLGGKGASLSEAESILAIVCRIST